MIKLYPQGWVVGHVLAQSRRMEGDVTFFLLHFPSVAFDFGWVGEFPHAYWAAGTSNT